MRERTKTSRRGSGCVGFEFEIPPLSSCRATGSAGRRFHFKTPALFTPGKRRLKVNRPVTCWVTVKQLTLGLWLKTRSPLKLLSRAVGLLQLLLGIRNESQLLPRATTAHPLACVWKSHLYSLSQRDSRYENVSSVTVCE